MHKVSIILPCFNVEKYLEKSIDSVLEQTYTNFKLLIIIDGSPDNSKEIAEGYAKRDERIQVYEKPNGGLSDARNYGLERAEGEFVYFMDSDDWIEPGLLEDNVAILDKEDVDVIVFGYIQDDEDIEGKLLKSIKFKPPNTLIRKFENELPVNNYLLGLLGYAWNKVYRRSFLNEKQLSFEKGTSLIEDILFNSQVYQNVDAIYFNEKCYYHYMNRPVETLMKQFHVNSFELKKRRVLAVDQFLKNWKVKEAIREQLKAEGVVNGIRYCVHSLYSFKSQLNNKEAKAYVNQMLNDPLTNKYVKNYQGETIKDLLYKIMIQNKSASLIALLAKRIK